MNDEMLSDQEGMGSQVAEDNRQLTLDDFRDGGGGGEEFDDSGSASVVADEQPGEVQGGDAPQSPTLLALVQQLGYNQFGDQPPADDFAILSHLVRQAQEAGQLQQQARQADFYRDLGQMVAPKADLLQQFFQAQQQPAKPKSYEPPPFDPKWAQMVAQDPSTGLFVNLPGAPADTAEKVGAWVSWRDTFLQDPAAVIAPLVEERARAIVQEEFNQRAASQSLHAQVQGIAQANASWFYAHGEDGQPAVGPDGRAQISQAGHQYLGLVREAGDLGISDPAGRDLYARRILASAGAIGGQGQQHAEQAQQPRGPQGQVHGASTGPRRGKVQQALDQAQQDAVPKTFAERMRLAMDQEGITDRDLRQDGAWAPAGWGRIA